MAFGDEVVLASDPTNEEEEEEEELVGETVEDSNDEDSEETETEMVDPQDTKKEECTQSSECQQYKARLDSCNERVGGSQTEETCEEELFDFFHCVDGCVSKELFNQLK